MVGEPDYGLTGNPCANGFMLADGAPQEFWVDITELVLECVPENSPDREQLRLYLNTRVPVYYETLWNVFMNGMPDCEAVTLEDFKTDAALNKLKACAYRRLWEKLTRCIPDDWQG